MKPGQKLRAMRQAKGHGLRKVGELTGVSIATISRVERGCGNADMPTLTKLAQYYDVPLAEFVDMPLPASLNIPADIKRTLLDALETERQEWGESAELVNARLWLEGKLNGDGAARE